MEMKSANVLKKGAWEIRQLELHMQNDQQDAKKTPPDSHFEKLAGIRDDRG